VINAAELNLLFSFSITHISKNFSHIIYGIAAVKKKKRKEREKKKNLTNITSILRTVEESYSRKGDKIK